MLMVIISKGRLRYMRFIVTSSGNSLTHGPHQVAQTLINSSFCESFFASILTASASIGEIFTGSASHLAKDFLALSLLLAHLVEQPKTLVTSTGTFFPAKRASIAFRASCE